MSNYRVYFPQIVDSNYFNGELTIRTIEDVRRIWAEINEEVSPSIGRYIRDLYPSTEDLVRESIERATRNIQQAYSKRKKLFLDDFRLPEHVSYYKPNESIYREEGWDIVANYEEFVEYISKNGLPDLISFDHDLADEHYTPPEYWEDYERSKEYQESKEYKEKTGKECAEWLIQYCIEKRVPLPQTLIHSQNPVGAIRIEKTLEDGKTTLRGLFRNGTISRDYSSSSSSEALRFKAHQLKEAFLSKLDIEDENLNFDGLNNFLLSVRGYGLDLDDLDNFKELVENYKRDTR